MTLAVRRNFDFDPSDFTTAQLRRTVLPQLTKIANSRLYRLQQRGVNQFAYDVARTYLEGRGRLYFSSAQSLTNSQVRDEVIALQRFLNSRTSTVSGQYEIDRSVIERFRELGLDIEDERAFLDFLSSQQFRTLSTRYDSNIVIEDFIQAQEEGFTVDEIYAEYQEFLESSMTFEQIEENRQQLLNLRRNQ